MATFPINDLGNWTIGQLSPQWEMPLSRGSRVMDLTGVSTNQLSLIIYNSAKSPTGTGAGSFTIDNAKPGVVTYAQDVADLASAGTFYFRVRIIFNDTKPDYSDLIKIVVSA